VTKPIKYGHWDGCAVRWRSWEAWLLGMDGVWRETNAADVAHKAWVHTEATYHELFGHDLPPLPDEAFRSGWRSPLV
jgi:hypothetical protein